MAIWEHIPSSGVNGVSISLESGPGRSPKVWIERVYDHEQGDSTLLTMREKDESRRGEGERGPGCHRSATRTAILPFVSTLLMLISLLQPTVALLTAQRPDLIVSRPALTSRAPNQTSPVLECLQVSPPVLSPKSCQQTLMIHTFAWSYGMPFVGAYVPPECDFNRVTINFTVTSAGRQYDRLALMFFNDTEVFRTSTAEPTQNGIIWTYIKDMSNYLALFKSPQKLIFDLGNLVDDTYTGSWNTILTASFFTADDDIDAADVIIPVSARQSAADKPSAFTVPDTKAVNSLTLPQNVKKAVFTISACGQATEEFWWANVLSSDTTVFGNDTTLYGYSPFRELQLFIDGMLAGVAWPFPVIFTGGVVPGFWRPIVGIDAFDLREDEIDISAFLPVLCDGKEHIFEIRVAGISDDGHGQGNLTGTVGSNWVVTGKVFIWLSESSDDITTGTVPTIAAPEPSLSLSSSATKGANGSVTSLDYSVKTVRKLSVSSTLQTSKGPRNVTWQQDLSFWITGQLTNGGNDQSTSQGTTGQDSSSNDYSKSYDYPLWVISSYKVLSGGNFTIDGKMGRGKYVRTLGDLAFPSAADTYDYSRLPTGYSYSFKGTQINNFQNGSASYLGAPALKRSFGTGKTEQLYSLSGIVNPAASNVDLYRRHIVAQNDSIIYDQESMGEDVRVSQSSHPRPAGSRPVYAQHAIRAMLGRGPI